MTTPSNRYNPAPSEGHTSAVEIEKITRRTEPTRHLYDNAKYTPSVNTNIARTFRKARLLARIQGASA